LGTCVAMDMKKMVPDTSRSVMQGGLVPLGEPKNRWKIHYFEGVLKRHGAGVNTPWRDIPKKGRDELLYGVEGRITFEWRRRNGSIMRHRDSFEGIIPPLERRFAEGRNPVLRKRLNALMRVGQCPSCGGARLTPEALSVQIEKQSLTDVTGMTIQQAYQFFDGVALSPTQTRIAEDALKEITGRLKFLLDVGLDYLTLDRTAPTLSGGEAQRIRLASQIGSGLVGVTYVLDEPYRVALPRQSASVGCALSTA